MAHSTKILNSLLFAGVVLCLLQIWLPGYYLTCDGPCHLYNAGIVHNLWSNNNTTLYNQFYDLVYTTDPNSMGTFALAVLLYIFKGAVAEKIFLTAYVLIYITGFCALLRKISNGNNYWQLSVFIFIFTYALSKGFYNFSFSIAFYFWMVWAWLRFMDKRSIANTALFFIFTAFTFFTHLLPFVFGLFTCAALVLSYALADADNYKQKPISFILSKGLVLAGLLAPFILLMFRFTGKEGGLQLQLKPHPYRLLELVEFKYIINVVNGERLWAAIAGSTLTLPFVYLIIKLLPKFKIHKYDGFLLSLLAVVFVYTFFPEDFMGRAIIISIRAQLFIMIITACCIAYRIPEGMVKNIATATLFLCFIVLSTYRITCRQNASEALTDYLSVATHIKPGSTVLPFDFAPSGKDGSGNLIADRNAIFHHASQYMGVNKPLIILDNYEANMGYFPIRWKPGVNPYNHLSKEEGIEGLPPFARIEDYKQKTGVTVDYIIFWCYNPSYLTNARFNELYTEINTHYHITYTSPGGRTILFTRNN